MSFDQILVNVEKHIDLKDWEKECFTHMLVRKEADRKALILEQGNTCSKISFVNNGILRAFHLNSEGKEATVMFAIANWWITDMYCFLNHKSAMVSIEAIEPSLLWQLDYQDLQDLYARVPKFERFFRILMQNAYTREQLRNLQHLSMSADVRFALFEKKYPQVLKQITQKQVASYLGITPEFLSTIRRRRVIS